MKAQNNPNISTSSKKTPVKQIANKRKSFEIKKNNSTELSPVIHANILNNNNISPSKTDNNDSAENSFLFDLNYIEKIINDHALNLLKKYKLKKLGYMFANLTDFSILKWLKNEP